MGNRPVRQGTGEALLQKCRMLLAIMFHFPGKHTSNRLTWGILCGILYG